MKFLIATIKSLLVTSNQSSDYERRRTTIEWLYANEKFAQQGRNAQPIFPLILQQPLPQREDLDTVAILFHDILLVLCHDHHSLEALNGGNAYQPEGLGVRHRITFFGLYVILVDWLRISPLQMLTVWLGVCHV